MNPARSAPLPSPLFPPTLPSLPSQSDLGLGFPPPTPSSWTACSSPSSPYRIRASPSTSPWSGSWILGPPNPIRIEPSSPPCGSDPRSSSPLRDPLGSARGSIILSPGLCPPISLSRSLKLGILPPPALSSELIQSMSYSSRNPMDPPGLSWNERRPRQGRGSFVLTRSCLLALNLDGGAAGALLRRLHLYNIDKMDSNALCTALSACQSLLDLEVIGLHVELKRTLDSVSTSCHSIERLFIESSDAGRDDSLNSPTCVDLVNGCPNIRYLALRGFKLHDHKVHVLVKGLRCLKVADFSTSYSITGMFLRNLGSGTYALALEVLILRDCLHLKEVEVSNFLSAVLGGDCKLLRYLDISNKDGLSAEEDWNDRCYNPSSILISRVWEERPDVCLLAQFPPNGSFMDFEHANDNGVSSSTSSQMVNAELVPYSTSSVGSSYSSDQGSGNEDFHDVNFAFYDGDGFDEVEYGR